MGNKDHLRKNEIVPYQLSPCKSGYKKILKLENMHGGTCFFLIENRFKSLRGNSYILICKEDSSSFVKRKIFSKVL